MGKIPQGFATQSELPPLIFKPQQLKFGKETCNPAVVQEMHSLGSLLEFVHVQKPLTWGSVAVSSFQTYGQLVHFLCPHEPSLPKTQNQK